MKMVLRVSNENGAAADVTVSAVDLVAFEEEFDKSVASMQTDFRVKDLYWLAHHSIQRKDPSVPDFKEWLATDPDVEALDDSETVPLVSKP
mgnify:CR=1 FL=1